MERQSDKADAKIRIEQSSFDPAAEAIEKFLKGQKPRIDSVENALQKMVESIALASIPSLAGLNTEDNKKLEAELTSLDPRFEERFAFITNFNFTLPINFAR